MSLIWWKTGLGKHLDWWVLEFGRVGEQEDRRMGWQVVVRGGGHELMDGFYDSSLRRKNICFIVG